MVAMSEAVLARHAGPPMRLLDWTRLVGRCLDATNACRSFSELFGARPTAEHARLWLEAGVSLHDTPPLGSALPIDVARPHRNGDGIHGHLVVTQPLGITTLAMVSSISPTRARVVLLDSFQFLTTLRRRGVDPRAAVQALYNTLYHAATVEDRERFLDFVRALEAVHLHDLAPRLALSGSS